MADFPEPIRERQAKREVGHTDVSRGVAWGLAFSFFVVVAVVPAVQIASGGSLGADALRRAWSETRRAASRDGFFAADRALVGGLESFSDALEDGSWVRAALLQPARRLLLALGDGGEQTYIGHDEWLFFRPDVDVLTAPGFLHPEALRRRQRSGDLWLPAPQPDPVAALAAFRDQLAEHGIDLVVMPIPSKAALEPEHLTRRVQDAPLPLENRSAAEFRARLAESGIEALDLGPDLARLARASHEDLFLKRDTHWTPPAVELAARRLAETLRERLAAAPPVELRASEATVAGSGDLTRMLGLEPTPFPDQPIRVRRITRADGRAWSPDRDAALLLVGDSFSNVYSQPELGWGNRAGLAEQIAYELGRGVDRIAVNAGGAAAARERLAAELRSGARTLEGKRVVVYAFAERDLVFGDWREVALPEAR